MQFSKTSEKLINWTRDGGKSSREATVQLFSFAYSRNAERASQVKRGQDLAVANNN